MYSYKQSDCDLLYYYNCSACFLFIGTQKVEKNGDDYDRVKLLDKAADELQRMEKKQKKKNPNEGFLGIYYIHGYCIGM